MKNNIDFATITVCGLCEVFPYEWIIQKVVWRTNFVEELTELANLGTVVK